ncbi:MAG: hypothetical protein SFW67_08855 [Myxococcaceae bacterium]|nr:hypothetical protein [Myxococcaceae bacterium]
MPRYAIGDLLIDLDLPEGFSCEYSLSGSLLARNEDGVIEFSALTVRNKDGSPAEFSRQHERRDEKTCTHGFGDHLSIATHAPRLAAATEHVLATAGWSHAPFDDGDALQIRPLGASLDPWLAQRRRSLHLALGFDPHSPAAPRQLDDFWEGLFEVEPGDQLDTMIACAWVGFGDLLVHRLGFQWCWSRDEYGIDLGCVALPETAKLLIVPGSFVGKRWERHESRFIEHALPEIERTLEQVARQEA